MDSARGPQTLKQGWVVCSLEKEDIHASNHPRDAAVLKSQSMSIAGSFMLDS